MATSHDVKADWRILDPATLPDNLRSAYADYKQAYALMKEARQSFEDAMSLAAALPDTSRLVFGYNFGKLSLAVVPNDKPKAKPAAPAGSLATFLASARLTGART